MLSSSKDVRTRTPASLGQQEAPTAPVRGSFEGLRSVAPARQYHTHKTSPDAYGGRAVGYVGYRPTRVDLCWFEQGVAYYMGGCCLGLVFFGAIMAGRSWCGHPAPSICRALLASPLRFSCAMAVGLLSL
jgi:hypothetical protein